MIEKVSVPEDPHTSSSASQPCHVAGVVADVVAGVVGSDAGCSMTRLVFSRFQPRLAPPFLCLSVLDMPFRFVPLVGVCFVCVRLLFSSLFIAEFHKLTQTNRRKSNLVRDIYTPLRWEWRCIHEHGGSREEHGGVQQREARATR